MNDKNGWKCVLINVENYELNEKMKRIRDSRYEYRYQTCKNGNINVYRRKLNANPITTKFHRFLKDDLLPNLEYLERTLRLYARHKDIDYLSDEEYPELREAVVFIDTYRHNIKDKIAQLEQDGYKSPKE